MQSYDRICKNVWEKDENLQGSFTAAQNESSIQKNYENLKNGTLTWMYRTNA